MLPHACVPTGLSAHALHRRYQYASVWRRQSRVCHGRGGQEESQKGLWRDELYWCSSSPERILAIKVAIILPLLDFPLEDEPFPESDFFLLSFFFRFDSFAFMEAFRRSTSLACLTVERKIRGRCLWAIIRNLMRRFLIWRRVVRQSFTQTYPSARWDYKHPPQSYVLPSPSCPMPWFRLHKDHDSP